MIFQYQWCLLVILSMMNMKELSIGMRLKHWLIPILWSTLRQMQDKTQVYKTLLIIFVRLVSSNVKKGKMKLDKYRSQKKL